MSYNGHIAYSNLAMGSQKMNAGTRLQFRPLNNVIYFLISTFTVVTFQNTSKVWQAAPSSKAISVKCSADGNGQIHTQTLEVSKIL